MKIYREKSQIMLRILYCIIAVPVFLCMTAIPPVSAEESSEIDTGWHDTGDIDVIIDTSSGHLKISPYIYGLNIDGSLTGVTVKAAKQSGPELSTYNWETNYANIRYSGYNSNDISIIKGYSEDDFKIPALHTENLLSKSARFGIDARYVTLQMMGYVAGDSYGIISDSNTDDRFYDVRFSKDDDDYLSVPDTSDKTVYIDEYLSYLADKYGYASNGGINGYFLDYEPERWQDNYPILKLPQLTASSLAEKSSGLASAVKRIDKSALVFGPSVRGLDSYTNLNNTADFESYSDNYSWFIDYYLDKMSEASDEAGTRLLDVLDLHYITEAGDIRMEQIINSSTVFSNTERMQAVRLLWDSEYAENSVPAIKHKQNTPIIPTVQASIRMYYPETKLSFSEYNFGGGNHISGAIAQADVLGIFAEQNVYMACLLPNTSNYRYQKSAINLYTDYDGEGTAFGDTIVSSDNGRDYMSSVYAAVSNNDEGTLNAVLINKNSYDVKSANVKIESSAKFDSAEVYCIDSDSYNIRKLGTVGIENNEFSYEMNPLSIYMFDFNGSNAADDLPDEPSPVATETKASESEIAESTGKTSETSVTVSENAPPVTESPGTVSSSESISVNTDDGISVTQVSITGETASETVMAHDNNESAADKEIPLAFKAVVCVLLGVVLIGIVYIFISDRIKFLKK